MTRASRLDISDLTHGYGARAVVDGISLETGGGEILCLLGRSGCGKTTLLRLIAGLERPRAGRIAIDGRVLTGPGIFVSPNKRGVGMMFQDYALFPHLTALANANFGRKAAGGPDALALLGRVGLAQAARRYPHTLSAGEQQRVALVRALVAAPSVMLMDEPFSNLDVGTRDEVRRLTLTLLRETGTTTVIVTHDPAEAMMLADRIVLLHDGRIEQIGTPAELYNAPRSLTVARYFSDLNEVSGAGAPAYVRPHDLELVGPGAGGRFRVAELVYTGEHTLVTLEGGAARAPLKAALRRGHTVHVGAEVGITYAKEALLKFPPSDSPSIGR